jgi:UDP-N-acetylglucosamine 2-epimerase (non-hydrolysing)
MKDNSILICVGTRPEWLKIKPLIDKLSKDKYKILFTGQHTDLLTTMQPDYQIVISNNLNRLDDIISNCLTQFPNDKFKAVLVQGDTASAFACALAAFNRGIFIYYLEAGLRTNDLKNPYPEEAYRQMISRISDINFAPTDLSSANLRNENALGTTYVVGNTVLDNLLKYGDTTYGDTILVTIHRRENHHWIDKWFVEINKLAVRYKQYKFVLPLHPNPNVQIHKNLLTNVNVINPITHDETMNILKDCKLVITDSGGLQEEGAFFNKKIIVCRKTTERPEAIATGHLHLCEHPNDLIDIFVKLEKDFYINQKCPYGDGKSSEKIISILNEKL